MLRGPSGGFSTIRSVAFKPDGYDNAAVSMNMFDITQTPVYRAVQVIENEAKRYGLSVVGTQICGTLPQEALVNCAEYYLKLVDFDYKQIIENNILAIK
jgi:glutamate formiminotransferase/formiminotetrahydrofolate cyclodeaminase